jgi:hypothetical protein
MEFLPYSIVDNIDLFLSIWKKFDISFFEKLLTVIIFFEFLRILGTNQPYNNLNFNEKLLGYLL